MTAERVAAEQDDVYRENNRADADAEPAIKPERFPNVVGEDQNKNQREVEKVAVNVLHDERERTLAEISFARFANGARGRIGPERFVIRAAIVVTGESKSARRP